MSTATSASDRYEEVRAVIPLLESAAASLSIETSEAGVGPIPNQLRRAAVAIRALIDPATVAPRTIEDIEEAYNVARAGAPITDDYSIRSMHLAGLHGVYQLGIQSGWEDWEPENAPGHGQRWEYGVARDDAPESASNRVWTGPDPEGMTYDEAELHARSTTNKSHPAHVERRLVTDWEVVR